MVQTSTFLLRRPAWRWFQGIGAAAALLLTLSCTGGGQFPGLINGAIFEPTGTVFAITDSLTVLPELKERDTARFIMTGVYAHFDPAQDQSTLPGTELADLRHEIENNDWVNLEWKDRDKVEKGKTYTAAVLRDAEDNLYRVQDPNPPNPGEVSPDFAARVRFRRPAMRPNAPYNCPGPLPRVLCDGYKPMGSKLTVKVTLESASFNDGGAVNTRITLEVEKEDKDPSNAWTGAINGTLNAVMVSERVGEANLGTLQMYPMFKLDP